MRCVGWLAAVVSLGLGLVLGSCGQGGGDRAVTDAVPAVDARIGPAFTGEGASYSGDRTIIEGTARYSFHNQSDEVVVLAVLRLGTGSDELAEVLSDLPEGRSGIQPESAPVPFELLEECPPGGHTGRIELRPGTYLIDVAAPGRGDSPVLWRAAVIEVVGDDGTGERLQQATGLVDTWHEAVNAGDVETAKSLFAIDAVVVDQEGTVVVGTRAGLEQTIRQVTNSTDHERISEVTELEHGVYTFVQQYLDPAGHGLRTVVVFEVEGDLVTHVRWASDFAAVDEARAELCELDDRLVKVRRAIYEDQFTEGPGEVEAMLAEVDTLHVAIDRVMPEAGREAYEFLREEFIDPIDELTADLGWSPSAALDSDLAREIAENPDLPAARGEHRAFMDEYCFAEEDLDTPTDPVIFGDTTITTYNSTPVLNDAVTWGLERFGVAELEVPPIASATFAVQSARCDEIRGRSLRTADGVELEFCVDEWAACRTPECTEIVPGWNAVILHEIAHAWLDTSLDPDRIDRFLDHVRLDTWRDPDLPWDQNGVEHAADTIAWGLMDRDIVMLRIGQPPTQELTEGFRILTGTDPLPKNG